MPTLIIDAGNSIIKARTKSGQEAWFPHALLPLSEADYERVIKRAGPAGPGPDYLRVNGKPYVVGASAERHGVITRHTGAARYIKDYYGVLVIAAAARLFDRGGELAIFGSHAPGDVDYRDDLMDAIMGSWSVQTADGAKQFNVTYANAFDEGLGGWANVVLARDGRQLQRLDLNSGNALIVDIGGGTTDFIAIAEGGVVDYSLQHSLPLGILDVLSDFENSIRANNRDFFKSAAKGLRPERVRDALRTGRFEGGGKPLSCEAEAKAAVSVLLNRFSEAYQQRAGGPTRWDTVIATGGGVGAIYERLLPVLDHGNVVTAETLDCIHLANVRGGSKLYNLFEAEGWL